MRYSILALLLTLSLVPLHAQERRARPEPVSLRYQVSGDLVVVGYDGEADALEATVALYEVDAGGREVDGWSTVVRCDLPHPHGRGCVVAGYAAARVDLDAQRAVAVRARTRTERALPLSVAERVLETRAVR